MMPSCKSRSGSGSGNKTIPEAYSANREKSGSHSRVVSDTSLVHEIFTVVDRRQGKRLRRLQQKSMVSRNKSLLGFFIAIIAGLFTGTLFYWYFNGWDWDQSLFYTINAGLSIGLCGTELVETTTLSRTFTICVILFGSTCVAAALNLFVNTSFVKRRHIIRSLYRKHIGLSREDTNTSTRGFFSMYRKVERFYRKHTRVIHASTLLVVWLALGVGFGVLHQGWDHNRSWYFSVSTLATGSLQAINANQDGVWIFLFIWAFFGVPLYAFNLSLLAGYFLQHNFRNSLRDHMEENVLMEEIDMTHKLFPDHEKIDFAKFLVLELLRIGDTDAEMVLMIRERFKQLDQKSTGYLSMDECVRALGDSAYHSKAVDYIPVEVVHLQADKNCAHEPFYTKLGKEENSNGELVGEMLEDVKNPINPQVELPLDYGVRTSNAWEERGDKNR